MRVKRENIVNGVATYVDTEVIPNIEDKVTRIVASVAFKAVQSNGKLLDELFKNPVLKNLLHEDENGTYDIGELFGYLSDSVKQYGPFPVTIPPIPFISPDEKILSFSDADVAELKRYIERSK